ncbi:uncharacterized protein LODBEIA_P13110 [Lodderomyces beijingensis]|uniref:Ras-GAP domain-containing protein n=1 Tax=Lodderomyces beijingensis TaxID=1775926 RepID=A0ABP0ZI12_9ASCO
MSEVGFTDNQEAIISSLATKLESLLPTRTGHSMEEVEIDPQFLQIKKIILSTNCKKPLMVTLIITSLTELLRTINVEARDTKLKYRDEKSRSSTLLICRLLNALLKAIWNRKTSYMDESEFMSNYSKFYKYDVPQPLCPKTVVDLLDFYVNLLSSGMLKKVLALIRNDQHTTPSPGTSVRDTSSIIEDYQSTPEDAIFKSINEIDSCIEAILRFIAVSNSEEYYEYLYERMFSYADKNQTIPLPVIQTYVPLIKFVFFSQRNRLRFAASILKAIPFIRSNTWKQVFLFYFSSCNKDQIFSRPDDYVKLVDIRYPTFVNDLKLIFDAILGLFDETPTMSACASYMLSSFLIVCVEDFQEFNSVKSINKLKLTFNKRIKYISQILKESANVSTLESFEVLTRILHLAARLESAGYKDHPVLVFGLRHLDEIFPKVLEYEKVHEAELQQNPELRSKYEITKVNFYTAAILLRPEKYFNSLTKQYREKKHDILVTKAFVNIVKALSEIETAREIFPKFLQSMVDEFRTIIFGALKILHTFETHQRDVNASSDFCNPTIASEFLNIDENEKKAEECLQMTFQSTTTNLDQYATDVGNQLRASEMVQDDSTSKVSSLASHSQSFTLAFQTIVDAEEIIASILSIFVAVPNLYFNDPNLMDDKNLTNVPLSELVESIIQFCHRCVLPLRQAFKTPSVIVGDRRLFEAARSLSLIAVDSSTKVNPNVSNLSVFAKFIICNCIVQSICDSCLKLSLMDPRFKTSFLFLNQFLHLRDIFSQTLSSNPLLADPEAREKYDTCGAALSSLEKVLLLASCTHDPQFYNYTKEAMNWYIDEIQTYRSLYRSGDINDNLLETFQDMYRDETVFTGFVSLQKRHRAILRGARPTRALYHVWLMIYQRWRKLLRDHEHISDNNMVFRHFTGFLVSTSGCFMSGIQSLLFSGEELNPKSKCHECISYFFDQCIDLLSSQDCVVRVIVKDTLCNESHSDVYDMITTKLMAKATTFLASKVQTEESVVFLEQAMIIITAMVNVRNDGALVLSCSLPQICQFFINFINAIDGEIDKLRLKLRFCKLGYALESDRASTGLKGAYRLRNFYAKASVEWLEQGVYGEEFDEMDLDKGDSSEVMFLKMDLMVHCSKALCLQLQHLLLEVPDGIKNSEIKKYKDLVFGNYFSLFYKIIQKYTKMAKTSRQKHKLQQVVDNILESITNVLQYDSDIGIEYILPMGYHENHKVRAIFLNVFASVLSSHLVKKDPEEFPDEMIKDLSNQTEVFSAIASCATSLEHNLLASSIFSVFSYTNNLDRLLQALLNDEVANLSRSTDLFRRNSTFTRLLFNFAQDYGSEYLNKTLFVVIENLVSSHVHFEVEKRESREDSLLFLDHLGKIVDRITESTAELPDEFKFVCEEIRRSISAKFHDRALIAVGSFIFLRFLCPAIVSPEQYFKIQVDDPKTKRSLMQLVKILQNMANGTLASVRWPGLVGEADALNKLNDKILVFLRKISGGKSKRYPFATGPRAKPIPELRYVHKFIYHNFVPIRTKFISGKSSIVSLHTRVEKFKIFDTILMKMGLPKPSVKLQLNSALKAIETNGNDEDDSKFNDFMSKMSLKYADASPDSINVIHSAIFKDATPVVVVNLKRLRDRPSDMQFLVYKILETLSQVWDNKFYLVYDFTEFYYLNDTKFTEFGELLAKYSSKQMFCNCKRVYYFNIPRFEYSSIVQYMKLFRGKGMEHDIKVYVHSSVDSDHIVNNLCLDSDTVAVSKDCKITYRNVMLHSPQTGEYVPVSLRIGRNFLTVNFEDSVKFDNPLAVVKRYNPVEVYRLTDINRCEISNYTGFDDEFTIYLNHSDEVTFRSTNRLEILRFLYFSTSRLLKNAGYVEQERDYLSEFHDMRWFGRLYNLVFQGLLSGDAEVKSASAVLFGSLSSYFDIDFGVSEKNAKSLPFPTDATNISVEVSSHLAKTYPEMTYRFFKAYLDNYEKMEHSTRLNSILYISPWISNVYDYVYSQSEYNGPERVGDLIRQFCRITVLNREHTSFLSDYVWKKLFQETRLVEALVEEVVAFAIDSKNVGPDWSFIISIIVPSGEVCGEVSTRLNSAVKTVLTTDSAIALQSKLFEITVLVKVCSSLFFSSYLLARLYLADIVFFVTLFIDNLHIEVGSDLRNLIISAVHSFLHKPRLTQQQQTVINSTIEYFSSPRAKMLFNMSRDSKSSLDAIQIFNRIANFEVLCDYLNEFIYAVSSSDDKTNWKARWSSNSIDVAFNKNSLFQDRAVLVAGILAKNGVSDSFACRAIKLLSRGDIRGIDRLICVSVALARIMSGLEKTSVLPPILFWPQICFALTNYTASYQVAIQNLVVTTTKLMLMGPQAIEDCFARRGYLEPYIADFQERNELSITRENYVVHIFTILTQGLKVSQFRHLSMSCIKEFFKVSYSVRKYRPVNGRSLEGNAYAYLVIMYLCMDNSEFEEYLRELQIDCDFVAIDKTQRIPTFLLDFLVDDSESSQTVRVCIGQFFKDTKVVDVGLRTRFISMYYQLVGRREEAALLIYHIIQPTLRLFLQSTSSAEEIEKVSNVIFRVSEITDYDATKYIRIIDDLVASKGLQVIQKLETLKPMESSLDKNQNFTAAFNFDIKSTQAMFYRAACTYVEGIKLDD